jgi:hypothetical protein
MLIYHQALDPYHCVFRLLLITQTLQNLEIEKLRILDFYLLYPALVANIRLRKDLQYGKNISKSLKNIYHDPAVDKSAFTSLHNFQKIAINCLVSAGYVDSEVIKSGYILRTDKKISIEMYSAIQVQNKIPINNFIIEKLASLPLLGKDGLKDRTGLIEYRYDIT